MSGRKRTTGKLRDICMIMQEFHLTKVTMKDISLEMSYSGFKDRSDVVTMDPAPYLAEGPIKDPLDNIMTEDEVLFWSSGGSEFKDTNGKEVPVPLVGDVHE